MTDGKIQILLVLMMLLQGLILLHSIMSRKEMKRAEKDLDAAQKCVERLQKHLQRTSIKKENDDTVE